MAKQQRFINLIIKGLKVKVDIPTDAKLYKELLQIAHDNKGSLSYKNASTVTFKFPKRQNAASFKKDCTQESENNESITDKQQFFNRPILPNLKVGRI